MKAQGAIAKEFPALPDGEFNAGVKGFFFVVLNGREDLLNFIRNARTAGLAEVDDAGIVCHSDDPWDDPRRDS